ncbi:hypothetical protein NEPAR04_1484 [Nematocida parisii]|nr:hypothetical protein NEPAR08_1668 [Nematocida parisii]KAI5129629.1 hypothetical protein NEPAR03_1759 [Nematocida parisii]KAI5142238.1 hypothetical protein NEPAR04_1484 [Nematocida parisii]
MKSKEVDWSIITNKLSEYNTHSVISNSSIRDIVVYNSSTDINRLTSTNNTDNKSNSVISNTPVYNSSIICDTDINRLTDNTYNHDTDINRLTCVYNSTNTSTSVYNSKCIMLYNNIIRSLLYNICVLSNAQLINKYKKIIKIINKIKYKNKIHNTEYITNSIINNSNYDEYITNNTDINRLNSIEYNTNSVISNSTIEYNTNSVISNSNYGLYNNIRMWMDSEKESVREEIRNRREVLKKPENKNKLFNEFNEKIIKNNPKSKSDIKNLKNIVKNRKRTIFTLLKVIKELNIFNNTKITDFPYKEIVYLFDLINKSLENELEIILNKKERKQKRLYIIPVINIFNIYESFAYILPERTGSLLFTLYVNNSIRKIDKTLPFLSFSIKNLETFKFKRIKNKITVRAQKIDQLHCKIRNSQRLLNLSKILQRRIKTEIVQYFIHKPPKVLLNKVFKQIKLVQNIIKNQNKLLKEVNYNELLKEVRILKEILKYTTNNKPFILYEKLKIFIIKNTTK